MCYHFFAAFHTNLLCAFAQKKRLPSQATAFFSANTHKKKAITFSGDRDFLRKHTKKKAITFSGDRVFLRKHTQKKAITFSGDRFESSIGISFF